jgi:hypothetical protein
MALNFTNAASDRVTVAANALHQTMSAFTLLAWVYPTSLVASRPIFRKGTLVTTGWNFSVNDVSGNLRFRCGRATATSDYITNTNPLVVNQWNFVAGTSDTGAAAGEHHNIYVGDLSTAATECAYGTTTNGSGTQNSDAGLPLVFGNLSSGTSAFPGYIAVVAVVTRVLTPAQIVDWQFDPRIVPNTIIFQELGFNGTSTQPDYSGNGLSGSVTGATVTDHVPLRPPFSRLGGWRGAFTAAAPAAPSHNSVFFGAGF